jgi:tetratricopeptide (TPR) repeat protein
MTPRRKNCSRALRPRRKDEVRIITQAIVHVSLQRCIMLSAIALLCIAPHATPLLAAPAEEELARCWNMAQDYSQRNDYPSAIAAYKKVIALNPKDIRGYRELGSLYRKISNYPEAIVCYKKALMLNPSGVQDYVDLGNCYFENVQLSEAVKWFKEALNLDPRRGDAYHALGILYRYIHNYPEAIVCYKKALMLDPARAQLYGELGRTLLDIDTAEYSRQPVGSDAGPPTVAHHREAIRYLRKAIKFDHKESEWHVNLGFAYYNLGDCSTAFKYFRRAIKVRPDDVLGYCGFAQVYYARRNYHEAIEWLDKGKSACRGPRCRGLDTMFARIYTDMGEYQKAEALLIPLVDGKKPEEFSLWGRPFQALGELYLKMDTSDKKEKVLKNYMLAADIEKFVGRTQQEAAHICHDFGDYPNALKYIDRALALEYAASQKEEMQLFKALILMDLENYQEAEAFLHKFFTRTHQHISSVKAYLHSGRIQEARQLLELCIKHGLDEPQA